MFSGYQVINRRTTTCFRVRISEVAGSEDLKT
jgi:hypothetical protein